MWYQVTNELPKYDEDVALSNGDVVFAGKRIGALSAAPDGHPLWGMGIRFRTLDGTSGTLDYFPDSGDALYWCSLPERPSKVAAALADLIRAIFGVSK